MTAATDTNIPFGTTLQRGLNGAELFAVAVLAATLLAKLWVVFGVGLDGDEAYYAMWSAYLSPGYLDHPPGIAVAIAAGRLLAGDTVLGVRLLPLVFGLVTLLALYRTTRLLVPGRTPAALAVSWYCLSGQAALSLVATPDSPSILFWMLSLWAAAEAVTAKRPTWWLLVGVFAGAGLASKYTNAWLGVGLVLYLLATPEGRRQLGHWQLWAGGALALAVFSPVLWWNYQHDWRSFLFQGARITSTESGRGNLTLEFVVSQAAFLGPVMLVCALLAIVGYFFGLGRRQGANLALPVLTTLPLLGYFLFHSLHSRVETNWTHPVAPVLALLGVAFVCLLPRARGWLVPVATAAHAIIGASVIAFIYVQAVLHPLNLGVVDRTGLLRGWEGVSTGVREAADAAGAKVIWTEASYQVTGELFFHGRAEGDPRPVRDIVQHERYDFIPPGERFPAEMPAVLVRRAASPQAAVELSPRPEFGSSRLVAVVPRDDGHRREYYAVFAVSEPTAAFPGTD